MVFYEDCSFLSSLRIRFRTKGPRPIEASGLGIVSSGLNLNIGSRAVLFCCTAGCRAAASPKWGHGREK
jgi:hypothetical protein